MKLYRMTLIVLIAIVLGVTISPARAGTWAEVGDAGESIATAQSTNGTGALNTITGTLLTDPMNWPGFDVDIYCIEITSPVSNFSVILSTMPNHTETAPLYLFDALGFGVTAQEGFYNSNTPSMITGQFVPAPGLYYLAIGQHDVLAEDAQENEMWDELGGGTGVESQPINAGPLGQWTGFGGYYMPFGAYVMNLTGANFGNCGQATPAERSSWGRIKALYR